MLGEAGRPGLFIGEQWLTVEKMLQTQGVTKSVLLTPNWVHRLDDVNVTDQSMPIYVISKELMQRVAGFRIHRGVLAVGYRPSPDRLSIDYAVPAQHDAAATITVLLCESISNIDNIGGLFRSAAAFGVNAVVLSPTCHDPLYRKSIRVSIGHVLSMPWARSNDWQGDITRLKDEWGLTMIAAATNHHAQRIDSIMPSRRVGIVVGSEFDGLSEQTLLLCDHIARIPMATGIDSLNVTTAAAICLHRFSQSARE